MKNFWSGKRVLVTGGAGFIGSYVCELLLKYGAQIRITTKSNNLKKIKHIISEIEVIKADLIDYNQALKSLKRQEIVLNFASKVTGIQYNIVHPVEMFKDNIIIAKNVLEAAFKNGAERFLVVSSACVYPRKTTIPTPEHEGFLDDPDPSNLGYGWSKRVAELLGRFYFQEFGMKIAIVRPYNAYGPRDNFDPRFSHVIPGIINRIYNGENPLTVWGTGNQTRSFLYAEDFVRGALLALEKYSVADVVNLGSNEEISIGDLARHIIKKSGKKIKIKFDTSKPDGQPRRNCDMSKAKQKIGFESEIDLKEGISRTLEWYEKENRHD